MVGIHHRLGDADGVGVVHADLAQHTGAVLLPDAAVDEVVEALPRGMSLVSSPRKVVRMVPSQVYIRSQLGSRAVSSFELLIEVRGSSMLTSSPVRSSTAAAPCVVDQLNLGELPVVEDKGAGGVLGQQGGQAQDGHQDGPRLP